MDHEKWLEQHDRMIADHEMRHDREMAELRASMAELRAGQAKTDVALRRAIRLSVLDGRRQRKRNAEFEQQDAQFKQSMAELSAALKAFLERGSNGKH